MLAGLPWNSLSSCLHVLGAGITVVHRCDWLFCALKNVKVEAGRLWEMSGAQGKKYRDVCREFVYFWDTATFPELLE